MIRIKKAKVFYLALLVVIAMPFTCSAALKLEQLYPSLSSQDSPNIQTVVKNNSLGGVIKFFSQWAIILAILASAISLLAGGAQYLLSGAKVGNVTKAKKRIYDSFIGLAILTSSFLILQFVNPQLTILQIEKAPVSSGVVFFAKTAFENNNVAGGFKLDSQGAAMSLEEMVKNKQAFFVGGSYSDLTDLTELGDLKVSDWDQASGEPSKVNFENFDLLALGFWGKDADGFQVELYEERYFGIIKSVHNSQGRLDYEGKLVSGTKAQLLKANDIEVRVIDLSTEASKGFFKSPVDFTDYGPPAKPKDQAQEFKQVAKLHPPLSVVVKGIGPGVYLYPSSNQANAGVKYFNVGSASNLKMLNFDDQAQEIEIIRENPVTKTKQNFLAVLYSDANYRGEARIFFTQEKEKLKDVVPAVYFDDDFSEGVFDFGSFATDLWRNLVNLDIFSPANNPPASTNKIDPQKTIDISVGNVPVYDPKNPGKNKAEVETEDRYGKVKGVSSLQVFLLSEPQDRAACREVLLCNQTHGKGECISFTPQARAVGRRNAFTLPMPWYIPVNIPSRIKGITTVLNKNNQEENQEATVEFERNIKSILINGNCLVGIFKYKINFKNNGQGIFDSWERPAISDQVLEIFIESAQDLSEHPIGDKCRKEIKLFSVNQPGPWYRQGLVLPEMSSCASSIVVFPLQ